ncbi:MAG TPA: cold shock domain-containing protein [Bryobacteraceae bacterium]|nr:cold shock domain-containing protein [Bryobacteraceae bacterium]
MNARQRRLFEEARKKNPDLKMPTEAAPAAELSEEDLALIKQGVGDKSSRPGGSSGGDGGSSDGPREQGGSVVTYFEAKGFGFLRPDDGGRDVFFHVSRLTEGDSTTLKPGTRVLYELGMDRTGKLAASSVRIAPPAE